MSVQEAMMCSYGISTFSVLGTVLIAYAQARLNIVVSFGNKRSVTGVKKKK